MLPIMLAAIVMGVAGHFCATFITIFGGFGILRALGDQNHGNHGDQLREDDVVIERSGEQSVEEFH